MKFLSILKLAVLLCFFASDAFAYIDAGTGSLIIQILIATLAVTSLFFRRFWTRIKNLFGVSKRKTSSQTEADSLKETNTLQSTHEDEDLGNTLPSKDSEAS